MKKFLYITILSCMLVGSASADNPSLFSKIKTKLVDLKDQSARKFHEWFPPLTEKEKNAGLLSCAWGLLPVELGCLGLHARYGLEAWINHRKLRNDAYYLSPSHAADRKIGELLAPYLIFSLPAHCYCTYKLVRTIQQLHKKVTADNDVKVTAPDTISKASSTVSEKRKQGVLLLVKSGLLAGEAFCIYKYARMCYQVLSDGKKQGATPPETLISKEVMQKLGPLLALSVPPFSYCAYLLAKDLPEHYKKSFGANE